MSGNTDQSARCHVPEHVSQQCRFATQSVKRDCVKFAKSPDGTSVHVVLQGVSILANKFRRLRDYLLDF
jgi:hypothetical protein